jgi:hypothetical protein
MLFEVSIFAGNAEGMQFKNCSLKNCPLKYFIIVFDLNLFFQFKGIPMLRNKSLPASIQNLNRILLLNWTVFVARA